MRLIFIFIAMLLLLFWNISFAHNLLEKKEDHIFLKTAYVDFINSKIKKYGYIFHIKYGFILNKHHNIILDHKEGYIKTVLNKNLKVKKYALGYQYINRYRLILNFLYVDDNLVEEADNVKVFGGGIGYKNIEIKQYIQKFKHFNVYETDVRYFLPLESLKGALIGKYITIDKRQYISKNASKNYLTAGIIIHGDIKKIHYGFGGLIGNRVFTVLDNGMNLQHHPFEFRYSTFFKIGKKTKYGIFHLGFGYAKAKELPFNNPDVKIKTYSFDYSFRF